MLSDLNLPQPQTLEEAVATFEKIRESIPDAIILIGRLRDLRMALAGGFTEYGDSKWPDEQGNLQPPEFQPGYATSSPPWRTGTTRATSSASRSSSTTTSRC